MSVRNHYTTLGVSKTATQEEIKAAFRKLSMETHPDVSKNADAEAFKRVAEAHSVLSNANNRLKYDRSLQEATMWHRGAKPPGRGGDWYGGANLHRPAGQRQPPAMHIFADTISNPRYILGGIAFFGSVMTLASICGAVSSKPIEHHHTTMVEAWKNPKTGRWEQPAPWDPLYQQLKPELQLVPREKVRQRHI